MASKKYYAYYLKGNKIAIVQKNYNLGHCSIAGYNNQTDCEANGGTWTVDGYSRKDVNGRFSYYIQGDELALLYKNQTTGKYGTWNGDDVPSGIRYTAVAIYSPLETFNDDLFDINRIDSGLHALILDYVKSRLEEDNGAIDKSSYFLQKYRNKVRKYPHRKGGKRGIKFPPL